MTLRLRDLEACFEGVIPSIIATAALEDGIPNISYLSHVIMVDDDHVALSNQFFSKTAANVRSNPQAALLLVDPRDGRQFRIILSFKESVEAGPLFEDVGVQLRASSAQVGMEGVMRLRAVDIYKVSSIDAMLSAVEFAAPAGASGSSRLASLAALTESLSGLTDVGAIIDAVLTGIDTFFGYRNALVLVHDRKRQVLTTIGSRGYQPSGIGSEVPVGEAVIGSAAEGRRIIKISDLSRVRRFGSAIQNSSADENRTRSIPLPEMSVALSQIGIPMMTFGELYGILFLESDQRLAFTTKDAQALSILARSLAAALLLGENLARQPQTSAQDHVRENADHRPFRVVHHAFDDSVFIENQYIIKGVPGRLLMFLLQVYRREARSEFTNREIRLAEELRLPEFRDNLETRLLLLRRRLEEKSSPVRLVRAGRGRIHLEVIGQPMIELS